MLLEICLVPWFGFVLLFSLPCSYQSYSNAGLSFFLSAAHVAILGKVGCKMVSDV